MSKVTLACPSCGEKNSGVLDSRNSRGSIRRRRVCRNCGERWTTYEVTQDYLDKLQNEFMGEFEKRAAKIITDLCGSMKHRNIRHELGMRAGRKVAGH